MARPIILGVVGDSATGKTTITKGLVEILGRENVTHIGMDDHRRYDRDERAELGLTPLNPACTHMDIIEQYLGHLRRGEPIPKPVYGHVDGKFGSPEHVQPKGFVVVEGLLGYHTPELSSKFDVRVYLAPPEELRREWKLKRDSTERGYTEEQVLEELGRREPDSEDSSARRGNVPISSSPFSLAVADDADRLDAVLMLRDGLPHPDLSVMLDEDGRDGITVEQRAAERCLTIPGDVDRDRGAAIEEAIWEKMHFARHMRSERLGVFSVGDEGHRSESLAITQVLILYHLVTAKAMVAVGGDDAAARKKPAGRGVAALL